jgi:hypothetical protein
LACDNDGTFESPSSASTTPRPECRLSLSLVSPAAQGCLPLITSSPSPRLDFAIPRWPTITVTFSTTLHASLLGTVLRVNTRQLRSAPSSVHVGLSCLPPSLTLSQAGSHSRADLRRLNRCRRGVQRDGSCTWCLGMCLHGCIRITGLKSSTPLTSDDEEISKDQNRNYRVPVLYHKQVTFFTCQP